MASWLLGISKLKTDNIIENNDTNQPSFPTTTANAESTTNLSTANNLSYDLKPIKPTTSAIPDRDVKQINSLDSIPFVLSSEINTNIDSCNLNLEDTKKYLSYVKNLLDSDVFNYDFSNDRRLVSDAKMYSA